MATIPNAENIQRIVPKGIPGVVRLSPANVTGFGEIVSAFKGLQKENAEYEASKAEIDFLTLKNKKERDSIRDIDYKTMDDRYVGDLSKGLGEIALNISDPKMREEFVNRSKFRIDQGRTNIQRLSFGKEKDFERSVVNKDLNNLREIVLTGDPEQVSEAKLAMSNRMDSAISLGYYSNEEAGNIKKAWREDAAVARLESMPPENRIEALKQSWAKDLPTDVRTKLKRNAEEAELAGKAIDNVDSYLAKDFDREDVLKATGKIKDDALRKETERRFDYAYNKNRLADLERQQELQEQYSEGIADPNDELTIDSIDKEDWAEMSFEVKQNLRNLEANSVKPRSNSDPDLLIELALLKAKGDYEGIWKKLQSDSSRLNANDRVSFSKIAIDGVMPIEVNDQLTDIQAIQGKLAEADITDKNKNQQTLILNKIGEWRRNYIERNNKLPDDGDRVKFIDDLLINAPTDIGFIYDSESPLYKLDDEGWAKVVDEVGEEAPDIARKIDEYFQKNPEQFSRANFVRLYDSLKDK